MPLFLIPVAAASSMPGVTFAVIAGEYSIAAAVYFGIKYWLQEKQTTPANRVTEEVRKKLEPRRCTLQAVSVLVEEASMVATQSLAALKDATAVLGETHHTMADTIHMAKDTSETLLASSEILKESLLKQTQEELEKLKNALDAQTATVTELQAIVKNITEENTTLKTLLAEKQQRNQLLESQTRRLSNQVRFFKQLTQNLIPMDNLDYSNGHSPS